MVIKNELVITEYDILQCKYPKEKGYITPKVFQELEEFITKNNEIVDYFKITSKKPYGKVLQAQNYVGVIQTKSGTVIEILPKISKLEDNKDKEFKKEKEILIKMLKTLKKSPFKNFSMANLKSMNMPLLEIFITMFLEELSTLIKKGIKSNYILKEENLKFLKGKLLISQQIKRNTIHKERFFVEYEEFSMNRVENRLIKSTLLYLYNKTNSNKNKKRVREFLFVFDNIPESKNIKNDFSKIHLDRQMRSYKQTLLWCEVFLLGNSFSPYRGNEVAFALLFDMNMLFESYVGNFLKIHENYKEYQISLQDTGHHLAYLGNNGRFKLKPDIVLRSKINNNNIIIADTKWKVLSDNKSHNGVSQGDMYQLYAYGTKYKNVENMYLIYPKNCELEEVEYNYFNEDNKILKLKIIFFDLENNKFLDDNMI